MIITLNDIKITLSCAMLRQIREIADRESVDEEFVILELISEGICRRINNNLVSNFRPQTLANTSRGRRHERRRIERLEANGNR
jgi:hypothetical protein